MALTKYNFNSFDVTSAANTSLGFNASANGFATISSSSMVLIKTLTASGDSTISFVDGSSDVVLDNTYPVYLFKFINVHPNGNDRKFYMQGNTAGASGFNETITSSYFRAYHNEAGSTAVLSYETGADLAQSTGVKELIDSLGSDNDQSMCGEMYLFNPSSTTFVKHFMSRCTNYHQGDFNLQVYAAGYFNTTSAIDEIQFSTNTGNFETGTFKLYGIKDS